MDAQLKYPVFIFKPRGNMFYVFWNEKLYKTTNTRILQKYKKGDIVVDSTGTKYVEKRAYMTGWRGLYGFFTGMKGRVINVEYEYEDHLEKLSLEEIQKMIIERYSKSHWSRVNCWDSVMDFKCAVSQCNTFEKLALMFECPPTKNPILRIWRGY